MTVVNLALRNLARQPRRTVLLGGAIVFGVFVMGVLNAVTVNLASNVQTNLFESTGGQAFFLGQELSPSGRVLSVLREPGAIVQALEDLGLRTTRTEGRSTARVGVLFGSRATEASLVGLAPNGISGLSARLHVVHGDLRNLGPRSIILPDSVAGKLGVVPGDAVMVRTQTITGQENLSDFTVAALVEDPVSFGSPTAYGVLAAVNELLAIPENGFQVLAVTWANAPAPGSQELRSLLRDKLSLAPPDPASSGLGGLVSAFRTGGGSGHEAAWVGNRIVIRTLDEASAPLLGVVDTLRWTSYGVLALVLSVILVGISNTFRMILVERTREMGTLRALGMQRRSVLGLFLWESVLLGTLAALLGMAVAFAVVQAVGRVPWENWAGTMGGVFFRRGCLGVVVPWFESLLVLAVVLAICWVAAWAPARAAASQVPAEALRTVS